MTPQDYLANELDLTLEELDDMFLSAEDLHNNYGNSGEMLYNHYFIVPQGTPEYILNKKNWSIGETVIVSAIPDLSGS